MAKITCAADVKAAHDMIVRHGYLRRLLMELRATGTVRASMGDRQPIEVCHVDVRGALVDRAEADLKEVAGKLAEYGIEVEA